MPRCDDVCCIKMRSMIVILILLACAVPAMAEVESVLGWEREAVLEELGEPKGRVRIGDMEMLLFLRGMVKFEDGTVVSEALVSREEALRLEQQRRQARAEREKRLAEERRARIEQGTERRAELLANERFMNAPPQVRYDSWKTFRSRYPEVPVQEYLNLAWAELQERRRDDRLSDLERRVRQAENKAERAAREARWNRFDGPVVLTDDGSWYGGPYVVPRRHGGDRGQDGVVPTSSGLGVFYEGDGLSVHFRSGAASAGFDSFDRSGTRALRHSF